MKIIHRHFAIIDLVAVFNSIALIVYVLKEFFAM